MLILSRLVDPFFPLSCFTHFFKDKKDFIEEEQECTVRLPKTSWRVCRVLKPGLEPGLSQNQVRSESTQRVKLGLFFLLV